VGPVTIAVAESRLGVLLTVGTEEDCDLQLDELLQNMAGEFGYQLTGTAEIE
jgi:hypothetical protein